MICCAIAAFLWAYLRDRASALLCRLLPDLIRQQTSDDLFEAARWRSPG